MLSSAVIETIIGLAFIYFLFAILCTALVEFVATRAKKRAKYLLRGLKDLLDDEGQSPSTGRRIASPNTIRAAVASEKNLYREALTAPRPRPRSRSSSPWTSASTGARVAPVLGHEAHGPLTRQGLQAHTSKR